MLNRIILTTSTLILLSACDSGSSNKAPAPDVYTGQFIDSPVEGLQYRTETQSGLTNQDGEFMYLAGEMVEFSIGGIYLGTASGQDVITPFSLSGTSPLVNASEITRTLQDSNITSFDRVLNIATLLQALDNDGDPENGIDLGEANSVLEELSVNFYVKATEFENQADFSNILSEMDLDTDRSFIEAAEHLYDSLEIGIESDLVGTMLTSENSVPKALIRYTYNQDELITEQVTDYGNNGSIEQSVSYEYDELNRLIRTTDSSANTTETISYNDSNKVISKEIDHPVDTQDILQTYSYEGELLSLLETDLGNDGVIDISTQYNYSANGSLISYTTTRYGESETSTSSTSYDYEGNRVMLLLEDSDGDGEANSSISYNYDGNGNILSKSTTRLNNGYSQTAINRFTYDANNLPTRYERDDNQDGESDYIEAYKHNNLSKRTEYKKDSNADGEWDFVAQYEYDTHGNRTRMIEDKDGNGIVDKIWQAEYQATLLENPWNVIEERL